MMMMMMMIDDGDDWCDDCGALLVLSMPLIVILGAWLAVGMMRLVMLLVTLLL